MDYPELKLRPRQQVAIDKLIGVVKKGYKRIVFTLPTGAGKTILAVRLCEMALDKFRRVLIVTNRRILVDQMAARSEHYGVDHGIIMAGFPGHSAKSIQIASLQTLFARYMHDKTGKPNGRELPDADVVIVDECFAGETEILTTSGVRRIDEMRCGDIVVNATGVGRVDSIFCKNSEDTVRVELEDGRELECTGDHPFFTQEGWCAARDLGGKSVVGVQGLCSMWKEVHSAENGSGRSDKVGLPSSLLGKASSLLDILLQEVREPNEQSSGKAENEGKAEGDKAPANPSWRERAIASLGAVGDSSRPRGGVGVRVSDSNQNAAGQRIPDLLQAGYSQQGNDGRHRTGWRKPLHTGQEEARLEEDGLPGWTRVVCVSRVERKGPRAVFNLRVSGHPSYFANGCLVHNCHQEVERYKELMTYYQHAVIIGLTATPINSEGLALVPPYQYMLEGCTNSELIGDGLLLKTKMFAPSEPDIAGVSITNGKEYNQSALGRAVQECTVFADVMKEWMPYFDRKTVCFVPGVAFGRDLERQFNQRFGEGFCHLVTAKTSQKDRERIFDAVGGGSSRMLISVDVLREGFDLPEISCMIDLQPNNQFRSYWQKVGRIKRSFPGQDYAVCLDLAGNCYKFLHPDEDPQWPEGEESSWEVILRQRSEKKDPEPIICPACDAMRSRGNKCPNCGHEGYTPYRRVRMKDGKLVEVPIEKRQKIAKSREQVLMDRWKSCLFTGLHSNMRLSQCARMFAQKYPDSGSLQPHWPGVEENGSIKWKRRVRDVFTPAKIMEAFGRAAEQAKATEM